MIELLEINVKLDYLCRMEQRRQVRFWWCVIVGLFVGSACALRWFAGHGRP